MDKPLSNTVAINKYFGKLPGQSLTDFAAEMKALTDEDKQELGDLCREELSLTSQ